MWKRWILSFVLKVVKPCVFLRDSGSEFQTESPKTEKDLSQRSRLKKEVRNCQQRGVERAQHPTGTVWMKKVRNIRWNTVLVDALKTETGNLILNHSLHWKPVECSYSHPKEFLGNGVRTCVDSNEGKNPLYQKNSYQRREDHTHNTLPMSCYSP